MRRLFDDWSRVTSRLRNASTIALFLDFDGTLAPLRPRPEQAALPSSVRQALAGLARNRRFRIWVISGRRQADVRSRVGIPGIRYLGLHGWERGAGESLAVETRIALATFSSRLEARLDDIPGIWIEDKEFACAVHYQDAAEPDARRARALLDVIIQPLSDRFRIECGKSVWEIMPREFGDKGAAVKRLLAFLPGGAVAVYVGDDQVDEPAFAALPSGVTVRVGGLCRSRARYRLSSVAEVGSFLNKLRAECG